MAEPSFEERRRAQQVAQKNAQAARLQQAEQKPAESPRQRMVEANHYKIYEEIKELITGVDPATRQPRYLNSLRPDKPVPTPAERGEY